MRVLAGLILVSVCGCGAPEARWVPPAQPDGGVTRAPDTPSPDAGCKEAWEDAGYPNDPHRLDGTATLLGTGEVLVTGGWPGSKLPPDGGPAENLALAAEVYSPLTHTWHPTSGSMAEGRNEATATLLLDGRVLLTGSVGQSEGMDGTGPRATAEIYDPATDRWTSTPRMHVRRFAHTATLLEDGRVLVAGGWGGCTPDCHALSSAELYDPVSNTWTLTGSMTVPQVRHAAIRLPSGEVFVTGFDPPQLYDSKSGTWRPGPLAPRERYFHFMLPLPSGRILVMGGDERGSDGKIRTTPDFFDPTTGTWSFGEPLDRPRASPYATLLADGRVVLAGGSRWPGGPPVGYMDIFDERTGSWQHGPDLQVARARHRLTTLADGSVLAVGGYMNWDGQDQSVDDSALPAERYVPDACRP